MTAYLKTIAAVEHARAATVRELDSLPLWALGDRARVRRKLASIDLDLAAMRRKVARGDADPSQIVLARDLLADQLDALPWWRLRTRVQLWRSLDLLERAIAEVRS